MTLWSTTRQDMDKDELEEGRVFAPKFDANGLIPAITQDIETNDVLMFAFMNREALDVTLRTNEAHYWSRSRQRLWHKGATSGHTQQVMEIRTDCDQDVLLLKVKQKTAACHRGYRSCFYRVIHRVFHRSEKSKAFSTELSTDRPRLVENDKQDR